MLPQRDKITFRLLGLLSGEAEGYFAIIVFATLIVIALGAVVFIRHI